MNQNTTARYVELCLEDIPASVGCIGQNWESPNGLDLTQEIHANEKHLLCKALAWHESVEHLRCKADGIPNSSTVQFSCFTE